MGKKPIIWIIFLAVLGSTILPAAGETEKTLESPRLKFSFWERIRQESWDNTMGLNDGATDSSAFLRLRTSLGALWRPAEKWEVNLRLTNENRYYLAPKSDPKLKKNYGLNEVFFDAVNVKWKNPGSLPLTLTVGRQDLMLGEGFLIMDGGPLDGSRSAYFNALRLDYALKGKNTLTFFFMRQPRTDTLLPLCNDADQAMVEQEEQGIGLYFSGLIEKTGLEAYLFRKDAFAAGALPAGAVHVAGARMVHPFSAALSLTAEGAVQLGTLGENSRSGLGGYFHLDHKLSWKFPLPAQLTLGGIYLSGDDPATERCEGWDPAFSRWPKWSESLIYLQARETRVAEWSNFISIYGSLLFEPLEKVKLSLALHKLAAAANTLPNAVLSGSGKDRGVLFIAKIVYELSRNLAGHFIWESLKPGDHYVTGASSYGWIRFELFFRY